MVYVQEGGCACGIWEKEITLTLQSYVIMDVKREWTGSVKLKIDFSQGDTSLGHDYLPGTAFSERVLILDHPMWLL